MVPLEELILILTMPSLYTYTLLYVREATRAARHCSQHFCDVHGSGHIPV